MVRPSGQRSSSEDKRSLTSTRITRSTTPSARLTSTTSHYHQPAAGKSTNAPAIGSVRITRAEDFYQPSTTTSTRSRSQTRGRAQGDSINGSTTTQSHYHVGSGRGSSSGGGPHHDMFVVGYATVTTHQRPPGSEGVNYKVYLDQPQRSRSSLTPTPTVHASRTANYSVAGDEDDVTPLHSSYHRYQTTRSSVSPSSSYSPRSRPYQSSSATFLGSSRLSRSTSMPQLDRAVFGVKPSSYRPVPRTVPWQPITSTADQSFKLKSTSTSRDTVDDRELYERLRLKHLQPYGDAPYVGLGATESHLFKTTQSSSINRSSQEVIYPERRSGSEVSVRGQRSPSKYRDFNPTDVNVVMLPNGQRMVTYTNQSQTGHGDHQLANIEIENIIRKTKHLQDSLSTLEEFIRRNRSLFPENILIYQHIKFFLLNEQELRRIGERPDARVYGVRIRERLVVPYGTDVIEILKRHYSRYQEVEIEYEDVTRIRVLASESGANRTQSSNDYVIRKTVESEYEERDRVRSGASRHHTIHQMPIDYHTLRTVESVKATPLPSNIAPEFEHEVINSRHELMRLEKRNKDSVTTTKERTDDAGHAPYLEFTSKLRNRRITEGNSVRLSCAVNVPNDVTIAWYRGPNVIREGGNYHMSQFYGLCSLDIGKVTKFDAGTYTVTATNVRGSISSSATLEVEMSEVSEKLENNKNKPTFVDELSSQVVDIGEKVTFKVQFSGTPTPSVQWFRDGIELYDDSKTHIVTDNNGSSKLTIREAKKSDAGLYCCIIKNQHGISKGAANLKFKDAVKAPKQPEEDHEVLDRSRKFEDELLDQAGSRPQFMAVPQSQISVHEGEPLTLRCYVTGRPKPTVTWFKGVRELTYNQRYRILAENDGHFMMQIPSTMQQTDSGEFSIVASNPNGSAKFTTYIGILAPRPEPPTVQKPVEWTEIEEYEGNETSHKFSVQNDQTTTSSVQIIVTDALEEPALESTEVTEEKTIEEVSTEVETAPEEAAPTLAEEQQDAVDAPVEEIPAVDVKPVEEAPEAVAVPSEEEPVVDDVVQDVIVVNKQERIPKLSDIKLLEDFSDSPAPETPQEEPEEDILVMDEVTKQESAPVNSEPIAEVSEEPVEKIEKPKNNEIKLIDEPNHAEVKEELPEEVPGETKEKKKKKKNKEEKKGEESPETTIGADEVPETGEKEAPKEEETEQHKEKTKKKKRKDEKKGEEVKDEVQAEIVDDGEEKEKDETAKPKEKTKKKKKDKEVDKVNEEQPAVVVDEIQEAVVVDKQERVPKLQSSKLLDEFADVSSSEKQDEEQEELLVIDEVTKQETLPVHSEPLEEVSEGPVVREEKPRKEEINFDEPEATAGDEPLQEEEASEKTEKKKKKKQKGEKKSKKKGEQVEEDIAAEEEPVAEKTPGDQPNADAPQETAENEVEESEEPKQPVAEAEEEPKDEPETSQETTSNVPDEEHSEEASEDEAEKTETSEETVSVTEIKVEESASQVIETSTVQVVETKTETVTTEVKVEESTVKQEATEEKEESEEEEEEEEEGEEEEVEDKKEPEEEAPTFSALLKSESTSVGGSATFVCNVSGKPAPSVEWYKDEVLLTSGDHYVISIVDGQHSLTIANVEAGDAGQYTVKATSARGESRCTATLVLQEIQHTTVSQVVKETKTTVISSNDGMTAPKFQQFLQSVLAAIETDATFTCIITGNPAPTIAWSKGDVSLVGSDKVEIKSEGNQHSLILKNLTLEDDGQYTIKAQNEVGETSCTATLLVHEGDEDEYEIVTTEAQDLSMPSFTQFLKSQVVKQSTTATLQCILECQPNPPKITWLFKGEPVSESENVKIASDDDARTYSLTVQSVSADNEGEYTVTASTDCAEISSTASIVIQPEAHITVKTTTVVEKSSTSGAADASDAGISFTNYLQSQVVKVDDIAVFACQVKSDTPPQVTWSKDGTELSNGNNISITAAGDKYCLTVCNAQKQDGGEYKVVLSTPTGRLSCTATLLVTDENVTIVRQTEEESASEYETGSEDESD